MDTSGIGEDRATSRRRRLRDIGFWGFGFVTSIAPNLVSGNVGIGFRVMLAGLVVVGVMLAVDRIRQSPDSTPIRYYLRLWPVMLALVSPLILVSLLGPWGGYVMFIAAAVVAVAVSSERNLQMALVKLGGMAFIAAGPETVVSGVRDLGHGLLFDAYLVFGGLLEIVGGVALLIYGQRIVRHLDEFTASRLVAWGLVATLLGLGNLGAAIRSPGGTTIALPFIGLVIAMTGCGLAVLLTPERVGRIKASWNYMFRVPPPDDPPPPLGQLVQRFTVWLGERSGQGPPPWLPRSRRVDSDGDSPPPA